MKKENIAFVFPGQGAQYVGMAEEFYKLTQYKKFFQKANDRLNYDLAKIMLKGPNNELKQTYNTQPAILLHSILALKYFEKNYSLKPKFVAGHSLGEFSALVAAEVLDWSDALYLVHKRGAFMIKASKDTPYKMAAVIGLNKKKVEEICNSTTGIVIAANFNTPIQTVISGEEISVSKAMQKCKNAGAKRIIELIVGGAFHSPLIKKSATWFEEEMQKINFSKAKIPIISNYTAKLQILPAEIKKNLTNQIISPVLWVDSVKYMIKNGINTFIEFGPGKIISGMVKAIDKKTYRFNISTPEDVKKFINKIDKINTINNYNK